MTTPTPIATFEDILAAMEQNPQLQAAMRAHVLAQELLTLPARFVELQEQVNRLQQTADALVGDVAELKANVGGLSERVDGLAEKVDTLTGRMDGLYDNVDTLNSRVDRMSGTVSRMAGEDYESHVCNYAERYLQRQLGISATVWATQRNKDALASLLNTAETEGRLLPAEVDDLDEADLILVSHTTDGHVVVEISITIQQSDVDRAISRAGLLAKATGRDTRAIVAGATEEARAGAARSAGADSGGTTRGSPRRIAPQTTSDRSESRPGTRGDFATQQLAGGEQSLGSSSPSDKLL